MHAIEVEDRLKRYNTGRVRSCRGRMKDEYRNLGSGNEEAKRRRKRSENRER